MESVTNTSMDESGICVKSQPVAAVAEHSKEYPHGMFTCTYCLLKERFDFKGAKPPFARQITYLEDCYVMKDPFSLPNKGEVLVIGADCSVCKKPVCLSCSIYYGKRFCSKCALDNIQNFPSQLRSKIKNLEKS